VLPVLSRHEGQIILFGFQHPELESLPFDPLFEFDKLYYERHMPRARWIDRLDELKLALADGKPTLVLLPQPAPLRSLQERGWTLPPEAETVVKSVYHEHALLAFNGALKQFELGDLFHPASR
jgi:hypothetical protein